MRPGSGLWHSFAASWEFLINYVGRNFVPVALVVLLRSEDWFGTELTAIASSS